MSFDVVASSRVERDTATPWEHALSIGLYCGITALALAVVGILSLFIQRPIIVNVLSLSYALLGACFFVAGMLVASRGLFSNPVMSVIGGTFAGAIAAAFLGTLALVMSTVNLRPVFYVLDAALLKLLTFQMPSVALGAATMVGLGAALGAFGAVIVLLPSVLRRPVSAALVGAVCAGLFQELIRILLVNSSATKWLHDLIYTWTGLTLKGAIIVAIASAIGIMVKDGITGSMRMAGVDMAATKAKYRWPMLILSLIVIGVFPLYGGNFVGQVFLMVGFFALMGMGLNLEVGLAGLLDLGFVAFYAVGAYVTALLMADSPYALAQLSFWVAMPIAVLASIVMGLLFGIPVLKVRGDYLAVATLGLGEIVRVIVLSDAASPLLAGAKGILQIPRPYVFGYQLNNQVSLFYVVFFGALLAAYIAWRLENSRLGRAWTAIRDDEDVAQALGINLIGVKLLAYGLGAAFAGLAGSIFAVLVGSIFPHSFQLIISINVLALIIVGGMGSLPGVVLGSAVLIGLPEMLREFGEFRYLFYGLAIIAVTRLKPEGLWPSAAKVREMQLDAETKAAVQASVMEKVA